jgi:sugar phosphate isomerase/epimerase
MAPRIALQLYTVRDKMNTPEEAIATIGKVAEIGYRTVEPAGYDLLGAEKMREVCDANGLGICSTHAGFPSNPDELKKLIEDHQTMGCNRPGIGGMPGEYRGSAESFAKFAKLASEVGAGLAEAGMSLNYHNHSFELARFGDKTGLDILIENSCSHCVMFELDLYWVQHGGGSPVAWIKKLGCRAPVVHFKDMGITPEMQQFYAEVGEGNLDWCSILAACEETGVQFAVVEQDTCQRDSLEAVAISYRNMKAMGMSD